MYANVCVTVFMGGGGRGVGADCKPEAWSFLRRLLSGTPLKEIALSGSRSFVRSQCRAGLLNMGHREQ